MIRMSFRKESVKALSGEIVTEIDKFIEPYGFSLVGTGANVQRADGSIETWLCFNTAGKEIPKHIGIILKAKFKFQKLILNGREI